MTSEHGRTQIPGAARIRLAHAVVQAIADDAGVDIVHVKGYSVDAGLYPAGRTSTDVDVMVRPSQASELLAAMQRHGWELRTSFRSGSIFEHAAALWHEQWGWADVHRLMPGLGIPAEAAFDRLWRRRQDARIAGFRCDVPDREHQAMLIVVHAARTSGPVHRDVRHLQEHLGDDAMARIRAEAEAFDAGIVWAAATGTLDEHPDHPDRPLWAALRAGADRAGLLRARIRSARGLAAKARILFGAALPNRDHLALALGHPPTAADWLRDLRVRITAALAAAVGRRKEPRA